ncbi:hypothetical protein [Elizabethkingia anophelis]|uniref:hypothetical protein n=1 Tax=Elizabethkingia anophelis TaxID=1117645 RepID=UPI001626F8A8|nr:hypothetical protein [Elizabethkingia anophelis]
MELKEFIKEVLANIAEGVNDSKSIYEGLGGEVAPKLKNPTGKNDGQMEAKYDHYKHISTVEFEVNLSNEEVNGRSSGIGVMLGNVSLGGKRDNKNSEGMNTRIKFSVPIILP